MLTLGIPQKVVPVTKATESRIWVSLVRANQMFYSQNWC